MMMQTPTKTERLPIFCQKHPRTLLLRIDALALAELKVVSGGVYVWCKKCHAEQHVLFEQVSAITDIPISE